MEQRRWQNCAVGEGHRDLECVLNHVIVGHDQTRWIDHEAGPDIALGLVRAGRSGGLLRAGGWGHFFADCYVDDRRQQALDQFGSVGNEIRGVRRRAGQRKHERQRHRDVAHGTAD